MALIDFKDTIYRCSKCGGCRLTKYNAQFEPYTFTCPAGLKYGFESYWPAGKNDIARGLLEGDLTWSDKLLPRIYTCLECKTCDEICYDLSGKRTIPVIRELKKELIARGIGPPSQHKKVEESLKQHYNPINAPKEQRFSWLEEKVPEKAKIIYFPGCATSYVRPQTAKATEKILKAAGIDFGIMPDEWCCGVPLIFVGMEGEEVKEFMEHNVELLKQAGAETVLCSCASCYDAFKNDYPRILGRDMDFEVIHTSEYFDRLIKEGKLKPSKKIEQKVTYHDPCRLGRYCQVYEPPREVLKSIPGLTLVEMERNRKFSWCCGGPAASLYADFSVWTGVDRLEEAKRTDATALATTCPACTTQFSIVAGVTSQPIKIYDLNELLAESLG